jgi:type II secretory pathway component PulC
MAAVGRAVVIIVAFAVAACGSDKGEGDKADKGDKGPSETTGDEESSKVAPTRPSGPDPVAGIKQPEHAIERVDDTRWIVNRDVVLQLAVDGIGGWLVTTKVANGYRVDHTPEGSVAKRLGFADGDIVVSVNDIALSGREEVRKAYAAMRESKELTVVVDRGGISTTRRYTLYEAVATYLPSRSSMSRKTRESFAYESIIGAIRTGVKRVGDTDYDIDRAVMQAFTSSPDILRWATLSSAGRARRRSFSDGVSIAATPSVLEELGLTKFDKITEVNGKSVETRAEFRIELTSMSSELKFKLSVYRLGDPLTLTYRLVDGLADRGRLDKALAEWNAERVLDPMPDPSATRSKSPDSRYDPKLDDAIKKISDYHYSIEPAFVDEMLENPTEYAKGARIVPSVKNGKANGFKLYAIRPSSVYSKLGLHNGDTIHSLNDLDIATPDKALEAYSKVKGASRVRLEVTRRGKAVTLTYDIR